MDEWKKILIEKPILGVIWIIFLAVWGGSVSYIENIKNNKLKPSFLELVCEWIISGFSGLIGALIMHAFNLDFVWIAIGSGIFGHAGGDGIRFIRRFLNQRFFAKKE